eukprot:UN25761
MDPKRIHSTQHVQKHERIPVSQISPPPQQQQARQSFQPQSFHLQHQQAQQTFIPQHQFNTKHQSPPQTQQSYHPPQQQIPPQSQSQEQMYYKDPTHKPEPPHIHQMYSQLTPPLQTQLSAPIHSHEIPQQHLNPSNQVPQINVLIHTLNIFRTHNRI